ncbi:sensor histidine kinase [Cohnella fermenti]|uniref:Sensor histidine kinase n=1 Tax=Cohnella fermenti TaxID=2565925 RepID=A0A4S4BQR4_9BACL|nr:histidine kinase [Cohnella fermenti]THF77284.1 sensor histidine kinase [Cohnella fermenti]
MRNKFFLKNLLLFIVPLLIPIVILGTLSLIMTRQYLQGERNRANLQVFNQIDRNLDTIYNETNSLKLQFGNADVLYRLEEILRTQRITLENLRLLEAAQNDLNVAAYANSFVQSIYVYVRNPNDQFLASGTGIVKFEGFYDAGWMEGADVQEENRVGGIRTERRFVRPYSFQEAMPVITFYQNVYSVFSAEPIGVIALNLYADSLEAQLGQTTGYPSQAIVIVDERGRVVLQSPSLAPLDDAALAKIAAASSPFVLKSGERSYQVTMPAASSNPFGWRIYSVAPTRWSDNPIAQQLSIFTALCVLLSLLLGLALSYWLTRKNVRHIRTMIAIIHSAERGMPMPKLPTTKRVDEYRFITQRLIQNFIERNYLQVQLSEKKYRLQALELTALQAQMNPHFLFNTLETINWKVVGLAGRHNEVNDMLENLSDLLKYSLSGPDQIVSLGKEIDYTKSYLDIQKVRYNDKFDAIWDYDPEAIQRYGMPKLMLQPLVENSIYHGIKVKEGRSRIKIKIVRLPDRLRIAVIDNGVGMDELRLRQVEAMLRTDTEPADHIGLANTNRRIKLTYGEEYGLSVRSKPNWGTTVAIEIPL